MTEHDTSTIRRKRRDPHNHPLIGINTFHVIPSNQGRNCQLGLNESKVFAYAVPRTLGKGSELGADAVLGIGRVFRAIQEPLWTKVIRIFPQERMPSHTILVKDEIRARDPVAIPLITRIVGRAGYTTGRRVKAQRLLEDCFEIDTLLQVFVRQLAGRQAGTCVCVCARYFFILSILSTVCA